MFDSYEEISSVQNPKVKSVLDLRERRDRDQRQEFLIEGYREILRAVEGQIEFTLLFFCSELFLGSNEGELIAKIKKQPNIKVFSCSAKVFHKLSYRDRPDGLLAVGKQRHLSLSDLDELLKMKNKKSQDLGKKEFAPLLLIAESIEKPGNLGTILRSADAVGVDAVLVCDRCTDVYNPNVVRASVGTLFLVPFVELDSQGALNWLRERGVKILAATPAAHEEYTDVDMKQPLAIAVGTEQLGLSDFWMGQSDEKVRIPMMGKADSLNVAMATTLLMYEALRQRKL